MRKYGLRASAPCQCTGLYETGPHERFTQTLKLLEAMETTPLIQSSKYDQNIEIYGDHSNTCFCCGKRTAQKQFVHYTTSGDLVNTEQEDLSSIDRESQGFFPIGSECAKKYKKEFIFTL